MDAHLRFLVFACLFVCLFACLLVWLFVCLFVCFSHIPGERPAISPFAIPGRIEPGTFYFILFPNLSQALSSQNMAPRLSCLGLNSAA